MANKGIVGIIPAAGSGRRLKPFPFPKELFPVGYQDISIENHYEKRPKVISQYLVENMVSAGAKKIFFILSEGKHEIMNYYGNGTRFEVQFIYLYQEELIGLPYALNIIKDFVKEEFVLFGMPDTIIEPKNAFKIIIEKHIKSENVITLCIFPTDTPYELSPVKLDEEDNIITVVDKPIETDIYNTWGIGCWGEEFIYLMDKYLQDNPYSGKEKVLANVFQFAIDMKAKIKGHLFKEGAFLDIGTTKKLDEALKRFHLN